jgi:hypothetical protein
VINKTTILKKDFCFGNRRRYNASFTPGPRQTFESRGAGFETANETCFESSQITTSTPREKGTQASETGTSPEFAMNPKTMEAEISVIRKPTYEKNKNNKKGTQKVQNYGYRQSGNNQGNIIHHSDRSRADEFQGELTQDENEDGVTMYHTARSVTFDVESEKRKDEAKRQDTLV